MASSPGSLFNFAGVRLTFLLCVVVAVGSWFATTQADLLAGDRNRPQNLDKTDSTQTTSLPLQQPASATSAKIAELASIPTEVPRAAARIEGKPIPGASVLLRGRDSVGGGLSFRWVQVAGPSIPIQDATRPDFQVKLPEDGQQVRFLLIVANERGIDSTQLAIPEQSDEYRRDVRPVADAGDDHLAVVGRQITLSGVRSQPRSGIGYRWVQVAGPKVRLRLEDGPFFSFVPMAPGVYRFALLVAAGSKVSEPDEVSVSVGAIASTVPRSSIPENTSGPFVESDSLEQVARRALTLVHPEPEMVDNLVTTFEDVATRMDLYESYAGMFQELSQRLEAIIPIEPNRRKLWLERVFTPLTVGLVPVLQAEGLDLSRPEGQSAPLTSQQRARLSEQFRLIADGFKASKNEHKQSLKLPAINATGAIQALDQGR